MSRSRAQLLVIALVAALVAWMLTPTIVGRTEFNGIPAAQEEPTDAPTEAPVVVEPEDISIEELLGALPAETYQVFLARDPFKPVIPAGAAGGGTEGGGTEGGGTEGGGTEGGGTEGGGTGGDDVCSVGSNTATCEGLTVTLLDVQDDSIVVQVDDTLYEVTVGAVFAGSFQVLSISAPCADLLYGDDMFSLCEGDRVLK